MPSNSENTNAYYNNICEEIDAKDKQRDFFMKMRNVTGKHSLQKWEHQIQSGTVSQQSKISWIEGNEYTEELHQKDNPLPTRTS